MIQVVILAGGKGTRLKSVSGDLPKPLVPVGGRAILDWQLLHLAACGVTDVLLLTGHGATQIAQFCGDGSRWGLSIQTLVEEQPAGTAGALLTARDHLHPEFVLLSGDMVFDFDLARMLERHRQSGAAVTLLVHPNDHPHDSDLVEADARGRVVAFHAYPHPCDACLPNLVNAGIQIIKRHVLDGGWGRESFSLSAASSHPIRQCGLPPTRKKTPDPLDSNEPPAAQGPLDLGKHLFPQLLRQGVYLHAYRSPEYVKDAGTPQRIVQVERDLASGRVGRMSLRTPSPAVFLDRDGTLNEEVHFLSRADQMRLLPGVAQAVARLNASDYRTVVVTNQPVIARGDCDEAELQQIHNRLETLLGNEGAYLDAIYYCPHGPEAGHPGERAELKIACECRKPGIGMIQQAARELNLDLSRSWMIGDKTADVLAAQRAGMRSVLVGTGYAGRDGKYLVQPDFECRDLAEAVDLILCRRTHRAAVAEVAPV